MHVDSWAAAGTARYDYFLGRAIEQQHGTITNIFFEQPAHPPPFVHLICCMLPRSASFRYTASPEKHVCVVGVFHKGQKKEGMAHRCVFGFKTHHVYSIRGQIEEIVALHIRDFMLGDPSASLSRWLLRETIIRGKSGKHTLWPVNCFAPEGLLNGKMARTHKPLLCAFLCGTDPFVNVSLWFNLICIVWHFTRS